MKKWQTISLIGVLASTLASAQEQMEPAPATTVRFEAIDVYIDSGQQRLAAYQFELTDPTGRSKIVGIEGGEHPAFAEPPYYDPKALMNDRVIIAAFNTGDDLPEGKTRVATIHVQITGQQKPEYKIDLQVAASAEGEEITATATVSQEE